MNRILIPAIAMLVVGAPLAFAASSEVANPSVATTEHCTYLDQQFSRMSFSSEAAKQNAEEAARSMCREDRHKNGGKQADGEASRSHGGSRG